MFGFRTDNILPKDGYVGLSINTGKVYYTEKFGKVFIYFDGSSLNMFSVNGFSLNFYYYKLWNSGVVDDSFYATVESIDEIEWEDGGPDCFTDEEVWNVMCDSLFALLSSK